MVEEAREEDGPQILEIAEKAGVFKPCELECVGELWKEYLSRGKASGYRFLVCRENGHVVGFACFGPHPLTCGCFDLYWIAVEPEFRGKGIGKLLMAVVEEEVKAHGGRLIVVETSGTGPYVPARRLYEACGYRLQAIIPDFYAPGDDLLIYVKNL